MLHHVSLELRPAELDQAVRFWTLAGFTEVAPPKSVSGLTKWMERQGTQVHLVGTESPVVPATGHAAVIAPDLDATLDALRNEGFPAEERRAHWGERRCFVTAPGGHVVELMAAPP